MTAKVQVGVLFGGQSGEHEVSLRSARSVIEAIDASAYGVVLVGISKEGRWLVGGDPLAELEARAAGRALAGHYSGREELLPPADLLDRIDVVFPVLHGPRGEDGTVQGLFELIGMPYVGAGVAASALSMDKLLFKRVVASQGLPQVAHVAVGRGRWEAEPDAVVAEVGERLGFPVFTKPANLGSSVGISKCRDAKELAAGLSEAARFDHKLLVEAAVARAREIEVAVLGNDRPRASVPGEILPSREFYDYAAKYLDDGDRASKLLIPAPLAAEVAERARELAVRTFLAVDGSGLGRVDLLLSAETGALFVNEINTMPGFTSISMYPKLWQATGIPYRDLISQLIELAFERHKERARNLTRYEPGA